MIQTVSPPSPLLPGGDPFTAPITVLSVAADREDADRISTRLGQDDQICIETVTASAVPTRLDSVDCVVSEDDLSDDDLLELLATIREREPDLPFVLLASDPSAEVVATLCETPWTDCLRSGGDVEQTDVLAQRIRVLVGYHRVTTLARRALAAIERGSDAIAIVAPDGTVEFANLLLARQLGTSPEELLGRCWRELYPEAEVRRLESDAFPSLADGWRWIGDCEIRRDDGSTFVAQTRIDALDDDSLVFTVSDRSGDHE